MKLTYFGIFVASFVVTYVSAMLLKPLLWPSRGHEVRHERNEERGDFITTTENAMQGLIKEKAMLSSFSANYFDETMTKLLNSAKTNQALNGIATKLKSTQTKKWLDAGTSPVDVFRFYQLDKAGDSLLSSPQLNTWISYMNKFNSANPSMEKATQLGTFTQVYGNERLAQILFKAQNVDSTKTAAVKLQKMQINYWLKSKQKATDIMTWLGMTKETPSAIEKLAFKYYNEKNLR